MIVQCCYLDDYDWLLKVFYEVDQNDSDLILKELDEIDCDPVAFYKLADLMESQALNFGFTYTDDSMRVTFIIIGKTTCASEF